jgi:MFS family permease
MIERWHKTPLIELALFRVRAFSAASAVYFLNTFTAMGVSFAVILFLQRALEYTPLQVGFLLFPATLGRVAAELAAGHLADRWGARGLSLAGLIIFALSCAALGQVDQRSSIWLIGTLLILSNGGMALSNSPIIYASLRTLRDERISMGSGLLSLVRITGGTFGVGVVGPLVAIAARWSGLGPAADSVAGEIEATSLLVGYHHYFYLMAVLIFSTMLPAFLVPSPSRRAEG